MTVDTKTVGPSPTTAAYQESCASRLPCGVCLLLGKMCPLMQTFTPTWGYEITCEGKNGG